LQNNKQLAGQNHSKKSLIHSSIHEDTPKKEEEHWS